LELELELESELELELELELALGLGLGRPWLYSSLLSHCTQCTHRVQAIQAPSTWKETPFVMVYGTMAGTPAADVVTK
jgi:hypothetical protein